MWFLLCYPYQELFRNYSGPINLISINWKKYRYSLVYRFRSLINLRNIHFDKCYNLSPARGILTDEISLLSGSKFIYTTCKDLTYLGRIAGYFMNKYYDDILYSEIPNEYQKNFYVLKSITGKTQIYYNNNRVFPKQNNNKASPKEKYILISPLSTDRRREWGLYNYKQLCSLLSEKHLVVLTGKKEEFPLLKKIADSNNNIIIDTSNLTEVVELINNALLFIGGDSGLTHIALKLGVAFVSILDGGFWNMYFPYYPDNSRGVYIYHLMDCFGCKLRCLYSEELCITTISVSEVYETVSKILSQS